MRKLIKLSMALTVLTSVSALASCPVLKPTDEIITKKLYKKDGSSVNIDGKEWVTKTYNPFTPRSGTHDFNWLAGTTLQIQSHGLQSYPNGTVCNYTVFAPVSAKIQEELPPHFRGKLWGYDLYLISKEEAGKLKPQ